MKNLHKNILVAVCTVLLLTGCGEMRDRYADKPKTQKMTQAVKAQKAANSIQFSGNAEIEGIKRRLELTSKPGLAGYVMLINEAGQPILYANIKGKIISSGKRLTRGEAWARVRCSGSGSIGRSCDKLWKAPSDEGTHGSSSPYVYFFTQSAQYYQWNGKYLYSDKPFRLSVQPLVLDITDKTKYDKPKR